MGTAQSTERRGDTNHRTSTKNRRSLKASINRRTAEADEMRRCSTNNNKEVTLVARRTSSASWSKSQNALSAQLCNLNVGKIAESENEQKIAAATSKWKYQSLTKMRNKKSPISTHIHSVDEFESSASQSLADDHKLGPHQSSVSIRDRCPSSPAADDKSPRFRTKIGRQSSEGNIEQTLVARPTVGNTRQSSTRKSAMVATGSTASFKMMKQFSLTQLQIRQLQRIWLTVRGKGPTFAADCIYSSVFSRKPEARYIISKTGDSMEIMRKVYMPFMCVMDTTMARLNRTEVIAAHFVQLGRQHTKYRQRGFHPNLLTVFAECMTQQALMWGTKQLRNSGTQEAWTKLIMFLVYHMRDGYLSQTKLEHSSGNTSQGQQQQLLGTTEAIGGCRLRCLSDRGGDSPEEKCVARKKLGANLVLDLKGKDKEVEAKKMERRTKSTEESCTPSTATGLTTDSNANLHRQLCEAAKHQCVIVQPEEEEEDEDLLDEVRPRITSFRSSRRHRLAECSMYRSCETEDNANVEWSDTRSY